MQKKYTLISYDADTIESHNGDTLNGVLSRVQDDRNSWIIIQDCDLSDRTDIERLLSTFAANIAFTDKILNQIPLEFSDQLPDCLYLEYSTPTPVFDLQSNTYLQNRGSIVFGEGYLLLFYRTRGGFLDKLQQRVKSGQTRAQNFASDLKALEEGYLRLRYWTSDLLNIHRANVGERTNHIIYILTILSAIMLPITFISSVYGMNFEYMPGVHQPFGYYGIMLIMLAIVAAMIIYMKRKGWF